MKLTQLKNGEKCVIREVNAESRLKTRLKMLNVYEGEKAEIIACSPLKKNLLLLVGGLRVGIRKELAERITVEKID